MIHAALADVAEINPRLSARPAADEPVAFLGMADVDATTGTTTPGESRPFATVAKGYTPFQDGDLLVAKITPCFENGKIAQARLRHPLGMGSTEFHVIRPKSEALDARYALHVLRSPAVRAAGERRMTGSGGQRRVPAEYLRSLLIPLPHVNDQRRIADILDRADAIRAQRRRTVAALDDLAGSIFLDMFGDPRSNPLSWQRVPFGQSCERVTVGVVVRPASYYVDDGVPALRSLNVREHRIDETELVFFSPEAHATTLKSSQLRPGDVVIVRTGKAGVAAVVPPRLHGANAIDLIIATPNRARAEPSFLAHLLNSHGGRSLLLGEQRGQIQQHLNVGALNKLLVPLPPVEQQKEFARRLKRLAQQRLAAEQSLDALSQVIAASQHRAFRGEL